MEYAKPIMKMSALIDMGYPKEFLMRAHKRGIAWKQNPQKANSPLLFDTAGLEAYRLECIKQESLINQHHKPII